MCTWVSACVCVCVWGSGVRVGVCVSVASAIVKHPMLPLSVEERALYTLP